MDYDFWIRLALRGAVFHRVNTVLSAMRYHSDSKTVRDRRLSYLEVFRVMRKNYGWVPQFWIRQLAEHLVRGGDGIIPVTTPESPSDRTAIETTFFTLNSDLNGSSFRALKRQQFLHLVGGGQRNDPSGNRLERAWRRLRTGWAAKPEGPGEFPSSGVETVVREVAAVEESLRRDPTNSRLSASCGPEASAGPSFRQRNIDGLNITLLESERRKLFNEFGSMVRQERSLNSSRTCVVAGNGPSLNAVDWSLVDKADVDIIASNKGFLHKELIQRARFYTVVNRHVAEQSDFEIQRLEGPIRVLPWWLSYALPPKDNTFYCEAIGTPEFSHDILTNISWRHTVTFFNLQLAVGLGYRKIILVGMDNRYSQPASATEGQLIKQSAPDINHFSPDYFRENYWQAASPVKMAEMYQLAREAFEKLGVDCLNASPGSALDVFPRLSLGDALFR